MLIRMDEGRGLCVKSKDILLITVDALSIREYKSDIWNPRHGERRRRYVGGMHDKS